MSGPVPRLEVFVRSVTGFLDLFGSDYSVLEEKNEPTKSKPKEFRTKPNDLDVGLFGLGAINPNSNQ